MPHLHTRPPRRPVNSTERRRAPTGPVTMSCGPWPVGRPRPDPAATHGDGRAPGDDHGLPPSRDAGPGHGDPASRGGPPTGGPPSLPSETPCPCARPRSTVRHGGVPLLVARPSVAARSRVVAGIDGSPGTRDVLDAAVLGDPHPLHDHHGQAAPGAARRSTVEDRVPPGTGQGPRSRYPVTAAPGALARARRGWIGAYPGGLR
jgi:hypothetical protein